MNSVIAIGISAALIGGFSSKAFASDAALKKIFEKHFEEMLEDSPEFATRLGDNRYDQQWSSFKESDFQKEMNRLEKDRLEVEAVAENTLSAEGKLNRRLYLYNADIRKKSADLGERFLSFSALDGPQIEIGQVLSFMPAYTQADFDNIIIRMGNAPQYLGEFTQMLKLGAQKKITQPRMVVEGALETIAGLTQAEVEKHPFWKFHAKIKESGLNADEKKETAERMRKVIESSVIPAFRRFEAFVKNEYLPACRPSVGLSELPGGTDWYKHRIKYHTTTDMNAKEIHETGRKEVKRIAAAMDAIIDKVAFAKTKQGKGKSDANALRQAFHDWLRTDKQFYFTEAHKLVARYREIAKQADAELPKLFEVLPRLPYGVEEMDLARAVHSPTAYYIPGSIEAGRAGMFLANTYKLNSRPKWEMAVLTIHEAMPGHHLQIALAQENDDLPRFRRYGGYTAFVEGWALYSEALGKEMGLFEDPYEEYGRLSYDMWRALRLVIDTGLHAFNWTRQQAIDYFAQFSPKPLHDITVEVDRYITWPGQALAYKVGQMKMLELREKAKQALKDSFDIRKFHRALLGNGAVPMDVMEDMVDRWIQDRKKMNAAQET